MIKQKSAKGVVAKRPAYWPGHGEGLNLKISEEPVQLNVSCPTGLRNIGAKAEASIGTRGR